MESDPRPSRLGAEDLALIRRMGGQLGQLLQGMPAELPDVLRRDELGMLANMVTGLARELTQARARDEVRRVELERRVSELQNAYEAHEKLLGRVRDLSSPILTLHPDVLLVSLAGALVVSRFIEIVEPLIHRLAASPAQAVILDITRIETFDDEAAMSLLQIGRATRARGVIPVLAGLPLGAEDATGVDLSSLNPCEDLAHALTMALDLAGYRITR